MIILHSARLIVCQSPGERWQLIHLLAFFEPSQTLDDERWVSPKRRSFAAEKKGVTPLRDEILDV